ncbi:MAG TPA: Spx/MgsR family RNA polymerase-binding regulatory protein [Opitutus sp.]|nr:Spx/MgsR family RNA polymerase-binding regulatory protein [Opitutus sp.]
MLKVYALGNCDSCRRALKWLRAQGIDFEERAIRETPPTRVELRMALAALGGERRKLFNTAGHDYRELKLGERIDAMSESEAISLLAANGNLVKRPLAIGGGVALAGFDEAKWRAALGMKGK